MGHLSFMKSEYRQLHSRLMKNGVGVPVPEDPEVREALYEILRLLWPPEDALLASRLPLSPTSAERVAELVGRPRVEVEAHLERMANRGVLFDLVHPETGVIHYTLPPSVVGYFEFSLMRRTDELPQKRLAELLERYMHDDPAFSEEATGREVTVGRTLVNEDVLPEELETEVLSYERATALIEDARVGSLGLCFCRHKNEHLGKACDTPQEICTTLNAGAEWAIRRGFAREASRSELLEVLAQSRELGLVQMGDNVQQQPTFICHCCSCCCEVLTAMNRHGLHGVVKTSNYLAAVDDDQCKGCGRCARACPIQAISLEARPVDIQRKGTLVARIDESVCLGCGVCLTRCKKDAMTMKARPQRVLTPVNTMARVLEQAIESGRVQHYVFETVSHPTLARRLLAAITGLPPGQRLLASRQVRSRFIAAAMKLKRDNLANRL